MNVMVKAKDLIKLRQLGDKRIQDLWCDTQQDDIQELIDLMEEVASCAMSCCSSTSPAMAQDLLKYAKQKFVDTILEQSERYRCVVTRDNLSAPHRRSTDKIA